MRSASVIPCLWLLVSGVLLVSGPARAESPGAGESVGDGNAVVAAARAQIGVTVTYDPAYTALAYPSGDVPLERGVCTDVVIRALRVAAGLDLQKAVHEDMKARFAAYPRIWGLTKPDRNIDHRRVPNLQTWFRHRGAALAPSQNPENYRPGDFVTCLLPGNLPHIMIVSDRRSSSGVPLVIHNIGAGTREEDRLFAFRLTGHYRLPFRTGAGVP